MPFPPVPPGADPPPDPSYLLAEGPLEPEHLALQVFLLTEETRQLRRSMAVLANVLTALGGLLMPPGGPTDG